MSRTVAALYDTRAEAEFARAWLVSELKAKSPNIIGKDTVGAVDTLNIARADAVSYRERLRQGGHLLVAELPSGAPPKRIIEVLEQCVSAGEDDGRDEWLIRENGVRVTLPDQTGFREEQAPPSAPPQPWMKHGVRTRRQSPAEPTGPAEVAHGGEAKDDVSIGKREMVGGAARVRSFTRDAAAEEQVSLRVEVLEVETRPAERELSESEVSGGKLFEDRVVEVVEMREEPVVTKTAVVREEVIVRKRVTERDETIRGTVRRTEVEVEDLPDSERDTPALFGSQPGT
jgi:hypothetical protein